VTRRLVVLAVACLAFNLCGISVNAAKSKGKYKGMSRLSVGLKSVTDSAKKARQRLAALDRREDVLLGKIDGDQSDETAGDEGDVAAKGCQAKVELSKVRYEKRALVKKIKVCELNKKNILAEMQIVSELASNDESNDEIRFERPLKSRITSGFGMRLHPIERIEKEHQGIDFAGAIGDPVRSAANGQVIFAGTQRGYGKIIIIKHSDTLSTAYGHLSEINVSVGQAVAIGEKVGEVGMTGNSTGPHLHFEIRENGEPVNPSKYL
jgi:murein DD-endopeptidase MepM/ murein hydrolase activator NlpD